MTSMLLSALMLASTFEVSMEKDAFLLDGKPFQIRCGEVHFARVPRAYWRHRIQMCKAMGLNTVCAYMFWNYHELQRGVYDFSGEKDIAEFCRIAQEEGMWVLLRPGPYTCAEWEFGGLPWWLLDKGSDKVRVRTRDKAFLEPAKAYIRRVAEELKDLQVTHGGPILMAQDENEYGFFGDDRQYIREIYDTMREAGFDVPIFTCNPAYHLTKGVIPETVKVVNFPANPKNAFERLREVQPQGPLMCGEYYPAWYDSWGQRHHTKPTENMLKDLDYILSVGGSFSLYMAHGGTSFGWWAGCNSPFIPQTSSYDYEAPISEQGRATPKFWALRELMKKHMSADELAALPEPPDPIPLPAFQSYAEGETVTPTLQLLKVNMEKPLPVEMMGVGYGAVLYSHVGDIRKGGLLKAPNIRDQAAVYYDEKLLGYLDRRYPERGVQVPAGIGTLHILLTHMSRYNFGTAMNNSEKGLLPPVTLDGRELTGWNAMWVAPPLKGERIHVGGHPLNFKRFRVYFTSTADTFLLVRGWKKGHVWVNGHPLGRYWGIGPTQTMYVPGCWLKKGENEFLIFDFGGNVSIRQGLTFVDTPILDEMHPMCDIVEAPKRPSAPFTPPETPTMRGEFENSFAAQEARLANPVTARQFAFVIDTAWPDDKDLASIGEFEILNAKGESVPHDSWKFLSVSSEEIEAEDGAAENAIDGQISNIWHSKWKDGRAQAPHYLVIDMGADVEIAGFRYTPRQFGTNGRVRRWRFYAGNSLAK